MTRSADVTALLAHADWLRALARRLVGPAGADDAVQDTYAAALRTPPDDTLPPRPWLARVLRNATRMDHRAASRRARREDAVAALAPREAEAPDASVQRVQTFRMLVDLVLALDEPLRTTLVRHYFDGERLADIARATGVPEGTVRARHKQALDQLRARLDARGGGRTAWLAALGPLAAAPSPITVTLGGLVANKIIIAGGLAILAGLVGWRLVARSPEDAAPTATPSLASGAPPARAPVPDVAPPPRHVTRLATPAERQALADRIAAAREARHAAAGTAGTTATPPPALPASGDMDKQTIRDAMREVIPFLGDCFSEAQPTLGRDAISVHAHFTLTGDKDIGTLIDADQLVDDDHQPLSTAFDACLRGAIQTLELPPLPEGDRIEVDYPLAFSIGPPDDGSGSSR